MDLLHGLKQQDHIFLFKPVHHLRENKVIKDEVMYTCFNRFRRYYQIRLITRRKQMNL